MGNFINLAFRLLGVELGNYKGLDRELNYNIKYFLQSYRLSQ